MFESSYVSLNEAITFLSFAESRTPSEELALRIADQQHLVALIDRCRADAGGDVKYRHFPKQLPYFPVFALIERLENNRKHWPPSAAALHGYAQAIVIKRADYHERYEAGLQKVISLAAEGKIRAIGRTASDPGASAIPIEAAYFLSAVTIGHTWRDVGPLPGPQRPQAGSILRPVRGLVPIFYNVMVRREDFIDLSPDSVVPQPRDPTELNRLIISWYQRERATLVPRPTREDDQTALERQFPGVTDARNMVRDLRKQHPATRGRRLKVAKK